MIESDQQAENARAEQQRAAERLERELHAAIGNYVFDDLCNPEHSRIIDRAWRWEDAEVTDRDPDSFPVVLVRDGVRFQVDVEPLVTRLPALVDDQQPTFYVSQSRLQVVNTAVRMRSDALLDRTGTHCANCDGPIIRQWITFPDASREREVHADCMHAGRLLAEQPECFRHLGFPELARGDLSALPDVLETYGQIDTVLARFGFRPTNYADGEPARWMFRGADIGIGATPLGKGMAIAVASAGEMVTELVPPDASAVRPVTREQLVAALVQAWTAFERIGEQATRQTRAGLRAVSDGA